MTTFVAVADGVYVWRCPTLDVNSTLIVGEQRALLVDTLSTNDQARQLAAGVRAVTAKPVTVVNTHVHFDHVFGNATLAEILDVEAIWGHSHTVAELADPDARRAEAATICRRLAPDIAEAVTEVDILPPDHIVDTTAAIDLGDRAVRLWHPGPAHSPGDVLVWDEAVCCAGDVVEASGPPYVGPDSDVAAWRAVLTELARQVTVPVIPGHGDLVDAAFIAMQARDL